MIRLRMLMLAVVPAVAAGGLLLSSVPGHAEAGRDDALGFWPSTGGGGGAGGGGGGGPVAQADPRPRSRQRMPVPPMPPSPPATPVPAVPPVPPVPATPRAYSHGRGMSISIHDGKVQIDGVADMVQEQLDRVLQLIDGLPNVPPDARDRIKNRVRSVRNKVANRLGKLRSLDIDKIGPEMERMGDEIEHEMEGLDKDLAQLGDQVGDKLAIQLGKDWSAYGKDFAKSFKYNGHGPDDSDNSDGADDEDDDDAPAINIAPPADPASPPVAIDDLKLSLKQDQKAELARLRADSDHRIEVAKRELEQMSNRLQVTLGNSSANEADIERQIDLISAKEATIRKARVLAWVKARNLLTKEQRKQVESAAHKSH